MGIKWEVDEHVLVVDGIEILRLENTSFNVSGNLGEKEIKVKNVLDPLLAPLGKQAFLKIESTAPLQYHLYIGTDDPDDEWWL